MPLLSFVVAAHDVAPYIERCLGSILGTPGDLEVIVVDDGSSDGTSSLLESIANRDDRVSVIRHARAQGPGEARNTGLAAASGRYVWFVDGDDWLLDGSLEAVREGLGADPDVLLLDHVRWYPSGRVAPSSSTAILDRAPKEPFTIEQWPEIVEVLHVPWNKVSRRDLLTEQGVRFSRSLVYEDLPFTYGVLLAARRICVLRRPCVAYRTARPGALTRRSGSQHLAWADEWRAALQRSHGATDAVRRALFARMVWHGWIVLGVTNGWRVPLRLRPRFFARFVELYRGERPAHGHRDVVLTLGFWPLGEVRVILDTAKWLMQGARTKLRLSR